MENNQLKISISNNVNTCSLIDGEVCSHNDLRMNRVASYYPEPDNEALSCSDSGCDVRPHKDVKSSNMAMKAAQEAKEAQDAQQVAGAQASHQVRAQLAERANQAARAAEAALAGKQAMVDTLEHEVREAEAVVQEEAASCQQTQIHMQVAFSAAAQAGHLLKTLTGALQMAQTTFLSTQQTAQGAQQELAEKAALVDAARARADSLCRELSVARQDLNSIKQAYYKAQMAARNAETNVARCKRRSMARRRRKRHNNDLIKRLQAML